MHLSMIKQVHFVSNKSIEQHPIIFSYQLSAVKQYVDIEIQLNIDKKKQISRFQMIVGSHCQLILMIYGVKQANKSKQSIHLILKSMEI